MTVIPSFQQALYHQRQDYNDRLQLYTQLITRAVESSGTLTNHESIDYWAVIIEERANMFTPFLQETVEEKYAEADADSAFEGDVADVSAPADSTPQLLNNALSGMSSRWKNWWIRGIFSLTMITLFFFLIYLGPAMLLVLVSAIQVKCFHEIISIGHRFYKSYDLPWFRTLSWYFLLCVNYFFYGETLADYFATFVQREESLQFLIRYHRFISFALYVVGFCMFVLSLVKKQYRLQFYMVGINSSVQKLMISLAMSWHDKPRVHRSAFVHLIQGY
ncbi:unnamed protein product [Ranitomeya imitator]|uniref:phosphatidate cytidylyltransferase n=1 Tax=Ranitomeya imitator TaxID=111125 RepID=A0ABN9KS96_9NEOB|nr:unnamed protein product [Ranitomeya imitator]